MEKEMPSRTALAAAVARAAHLVVDREPLIFRDELAATLLGDLGEEMLGYHRAHGDHIILAGTRTVVTTRARYAERVAAESRPERCVILGAGLDTFAHRAGRGVRVHEVDRPGTQAWKLALMERAGVAVPECLEFVPVDLETESLEGRFEPGPNTLVMWSGASFYLTPEAVERTLSQIAAFGPGTELVMDYALPEELRDEKGAEYATIAAQVVSESGEPYRSFWTPEEIAESLGRLGFTVVDDAGVREAVPEWIWRRDDALAPFGLFRIVRAAARA
ncbi:class I SAM-dependent methyltransferase [Actinomadura barringtoniae]|uniref:S-adenosyl-L-methionine-dependent methyltransferase n=1 Tax=Actinomadura barringtoniae TaxID=1427535 RepID=A0A939PEH7_9ACTN|nr:SAM-dependent methyltransferase [Actinomadura barringtoniae]MBO2448214.1 class I SAM-dependent methyltransferase [Actinomadura barringtoniae]